MLFVLTTIICSAVSNKHLPKNIEFFDALNQRDLQETWVVSRYPGYESVINIYELTPPTTIPHERAVVFRNPNKRFGMTTKSRKPLSFHNRTLALQYETRFPRSISCSGGDIKLYPDVNQLNLSNNDMPLLSFGPNMCKGVNEIKFVFNHFNKKLKKYTTHTLIQPPKFSTDGRNHLFTLFVRPDNTFAILLDNKEIRKGSFFDDFEPPVSGPITIPEGPKPADWDDKEFIEDINATKPEDWDDNAPELIQDNTGKVPEGWLEDEPPRIPDPTIVKPAFWDEKIMGDFKIPQIANPKCANATGCGRYTPGFIHNPKQRGVWKPPLIKNPNYKGEWKPKMIPNPNYFVEQHPSRFDNVQVIGFELYTKDGGLAFKNVLLAGDEASVRDWNTHDFVERKKIQLAPPPKK